MLMQVVSLLPDSNSWSWKLEQYKKIDVSKQEEHINLLLQDLDSLKRRNFVLLNDARLHTEKAGLIKSTHAIVDSELSVRRFLLSQKRITQHWYTTTIGAAAGLVSSGLAFLVAKYYT
jgi:hypothetical protein